MTITEAAQAVGAAIALMTLIVGVVTAIKGVAEFRRDNSLKRIEKFEAMRKRYDTEEKIQRVNLALNLKQRPGKDSASAVKNLEFGDKIAFMVFFEDIALLNNAGVLSDEVTFYVFGWDALLAYETIEFWDEGLSKDDPYWALFKAFCEKMASYRAKYPNMDWPIATLKV